MKLRALLGLLAVLALGAVAGCASTVHEGRLYPLSGEGPVDLVLDFRGDHSGAARTTLPNGVSCTGEFVLWGTRAGAPGEVDRWGELQSLYRQGGSADWADVYGFGGSSGAAPVGTAILTDGQGTALEVVFYHVMRDYHLRGDGLARDNAGHWYRVILGPKPEA